MFLAELFSGLTTDQLIIFSIIALVIVLMLSRIVRYDVVSILALLLIVFTGILSVGDAFSGLIHPVVLIVISMFIMTRALSNSGLLDYVARKLGILDSHPALQVAALTTMVTLASAFINNVGALAPLIPVAIHLARRNNLSPSIFLLPLAFGSHLGGYLTLIGTPRNIIVSAFREEAGFGAFNMFDFAPVGLGLAFVGIVFLSTVGWRLLPNKPDTGSEGSFSVENYVTEVAVSDRSRILGEYVNSIKRLSKGTVSLVSLIRDGITINSPSGYEILRPGDHLLIKADSDSLKNFTQEFHLDLAGEKAVESREPEDESGSIEAIITPSSVVLGKIWEEIPLPMRYGVNLLAISRTGSKIQTPLTDVRFQSGDVILLNGKKESISKTISDIGCYPLAERELNLGQKTTIPITLTIFVLAILIATFTTAPTGLVFLTAALIMVITNLIPLKQAYESIQWPVVILIGSMITVGFALQETGGAAVIASFIVSSSEFLSPAVMVALILIVSMMMSDFISTTISAVIMAPIAIFIAINLGVSVDPFLMAVAVGMTSSFLTPFGHESNALVLEAGNYTSKDYLKVGLPLEILIVITAVPLILYFWPL